jgi:hypothetical protein
MDMTRIMSGSLREWLALRIASRGYTQRHRSVQKNAAPVRRGD